jgi:spore maturation protein CgeB
MKNYLNSVLYGYEETYIDLKILILCATLDLKKPYSATPFLLQWFKAFHDEGHQLFIIPYSGKSVESPYWTSYPNPNYRKGEILEKILKISGRQPGKKNLPFIPNLAQIFAKPAFEKQIRKILDQEKDISAILNLGLPLNQLKGLAKDLKNDYGIPVIFFDDDLPTSLPENGGFTFNHYEDADLSEYDLFIITSEGSKQRLLEMGANSVEFVHIGIDPNEYKPIQTKKDIDIFFFGHNGDSRKKYVDMMITKPSNQLPFNFLIGGRNYTMDLGKAKYFSPKLSFDEWREYSCRAKINLNVVHELHAETFATSTARPFELAAMGCCVVSSPYKGIEKWFEPKKEILIANNPEEAIELYQLLMDDAELRNKIGIAAQKRVNKEHTARHRIKQIVQLIQKYGGSIDEKTNNPNS